MARTKRRATRKPARRVVVEVPEPVEPKYTDYKWRFDRVGRTFHRKMSQMGYRLPYGDARLVHLCVRGYEGEWQQEVTVLIRVNRFGCHFPEDSPWLEALLHDEWYCDNFTRILNRQLREAGYVGSLEYEE